MMMTMLLGGLWHGASWTFVLWGGYHGALLCLFRLWDKVGRHPRTLLEQYGGKWVRIFVMFHLTCVGWLFFRAENMTQASAMLSRMVTDLTFTPHLLPLSLLVLFFSGIFFVIEVWLDGEHRIDRLCHAMWPLRTAIYAYLIFMIVIFRPGIQGEFIYFQF
jgi:D-alanyl-lipoteichoic acid acyltransferase DltB (MBOAT superfamily)